MLRASSRLAAGGRTAVRPWNVGRCARRSLARRRRGRLGQNQTGRLARRGGAFGGEVGVLLDQSLWRNRASADSAWHEEP